jgi:hypothetical protein
LGAEGRVDAVEEVFEVVSGDFSADVGDEPFPLAQIP